MEAGVQHRLLLSLRSERALGLKSIRRGETELANPRKNSVQKQPRVAPIAARTVAPQPVAIAKPTVVQPSTDLIGAMPFTTPLLSTKEKIARLTALNENEVRTCKKCRLCTTRKNTVFGEGNVDAKIFFIGEGPGENEDETGRPFVGRAGQLLDKMIVAMGLKREQVYIANIVKCRPPENRVPAPDEVETCTPYLQRQLEMIRPGAIVTLGLPSAKYMLGDSKLTMGRIRGMWREWRGIKLMPTYHPSYVLRNYTEETRRAVWSDLQLVMKMVQSG